MIDQNSPKMFKKKSIDACQPCSKELIVDETVLMGSQDKMLNKKCELGDSISPTNMLSSAK